MDYITVSQEFFLTSEAFVIILAQVINVSLFILFEIWSFCVGDNTRNLHGTYQIEPAFCHALTLPYCLHFFVECTCK